MVLNDTELGILRCYAEGDSVLETAEKLGISEHLVHDATVVIYRLLDATNKPHAVAQAMRAGLIA